MDVNPLASPRQTYHRRVTNSLINDTPSRPSILRGPPTDWRPGEVADYVAFPHHADTFELSPHLERAQAADDTTPLRRPSLPTQAVPVLGWSVPSRWQLLAIGISTFASLVGTSTLSIASANRAERTDFSANLPGILMEVLQNFTRQQQDQGHT